MARYKPEDGEGVVLPVGRAIVGAAVELAMVFGEDAEEVAAAAVVEVEQLVVNLKRILQRDGECVRL